MESVVELTGESHAQLRRRWPYVARAVWVVLTVAAITISVAGMSDRYDQLLEEAANNHRALEDLSLSPDQYAGYISGLGIATVFAHLLIAAVISWRRPGDLMALFVSLALVTNGSVNPLSPVHALVAAQPSLEPAVGIMVYLGLVSSVAILYVFPSGKFVPSWTLFLAVAWAALVFPAIFFPASPVSFVEWPLLAAVLLLVGWAATGAYAQIYRYATASSVLQRQQAKWAAVGLAIAVLGPMAYFLSSAGLPSLGEADLPNLAYQRVGFAFFTFSLVVRVVGLTLLTVALLIFPVSFAVSILRYRLWDIELLVNRTIVYGALTSALIVVYLVGVLVLESAFRAITGQGSTLAIVVSTLAIAALFVPLRNRFQGVIDRRFYRRRYDAAQTVASFSAACRDEVDLERLSDALIGIVKETMQPAHVSLLLMDPGARAYRQTEQLGASRGDD